MRSLAGSTQEMTADLEVPTGELESAETTA